MRNVALRSDPSGLPPYRSQWADPGFTSAIIAGSDPCEDPTWVNSGFDDPDEYRFWSRRICALACLDSVLSFHQLPVPKRKALVERSVEFGAYVRRPDGGLDGVIYEPFARMIHSEFPLQARVVPERSSRELPAMLGKDQFALWSVSSEIRAPHRMNTRRGGHMVLVIAADREGVRFHNPSGIPPHQQNVYLRYDTFERFSANRGLIVTKG